MSLLLKSLKRIDTRAAEPVREEPPATVTPAALELPVIEAPDSIEDTVLDEVADEIAPELWQPEAASPEDVLAPDSHEIELPLEAFERSVEPPPLEAAAPELPPVEPEATIEPDIAAEPQAEIEPLADFVPLPSVADEPSSNESTLDRLNDLHALIDAALKEYRTAEPIVAQSPDAESVISTHSDDSTESTVRFSPLEVSRDVVVPVPPAPPVVQEAEPEEIPVMIERVFVPTATAPALRIRDEYVELRDHLLARFTLETPCTLMVVDAGRMIGDASWLAPFAACLWQYLNDSRVITCSDDVPRILLVEAAGSESGISETLGIECPYGLSEVLSGDANWAAAVQSTAHPQIELLSRGSGPLALESQQLSKLWDELNEHYDLLLVAAGPWQAGRWGRGSHGRAISALLPLAGAAILSVELNGTPQAVAEATKRELENRNVQLLGCVVTGESAAD